MKPHSLFSWTVFLWYQVRRSAQLPPYSLWQALYVGLPGSMWGYGKAEWTWGKRMPETWCPYGCKSYAGALTRISPLRAFFLSFHADPTPEIVCSWRHSFFSSLFMESFIHLFSRYVKNLLWARHCSSHRVCSSEYDRQGHYFCGG